MASAAPRTWAASSAGRSRDGSGTRARVPAAPGGSELKTTLMSSRSAIARRAAVVDRLNASSGVSAWLWLMVASRQLRADAGIPTLGPEAALVVFRPGRPLALVALVEEGQAEREADVAEDAGILGPGDDGARRHDGGDVAVDEAGARQVGAGHH